MISWGPYKRTHIAALNPYPEAEAPVYTKVPGVHENDVGYPSAREDEGAGVKEPGTQGRFRLPGARTLPSNFRFYIFFIFLRAFNF